jgi:hypothetical protein
MFLFHTFTVIRLTLFKGYLVAKNYLRSKSSARRVDRQLRFPSTSEMTPWIVLGVLIVMLYWWVRFDETARRSFSFLLTKQDSISMKPAASTRRIGARIKIRLNGSESFKVRAGQRLVIAWKNPKQCDQEILLLYRQNLTIDTALLEARLSGLSGIKFLSEPTDTSWHVQWHLQPKKSMDLTCRNADYGYLPDQAELEAFVEKVPPKSRIDSKS